MEIRQLKEAISTGESRIKELVQQVRDGLSQML
jgi:hypothetical protein